MLTIQMPVETVGSIASDLKPGDHPYLTGAFAPNLVEINATEMQVIGRIPDDIDGVYLRNTQNQIHQPLGRFHPFDSDGMLHMMRFRNGRAEYRNRAIRTTGFEAERAVGHSLWAGLMEAPAKSRPGWGAHGFLKDASSTDVVVHAGRALTTYYQCGEAYRLSATTLEQFGPETWGGSYPREGISAHCKVDEHTGELLFFNYSKQAPYMHYGVVGADNQLKHYVPVPLPGPRLPHDMAFTAKYSILNDFPLFWDPEMLKRNLHVVRFHPELKSRFAVIPRYCSESPFAPRINARDEDDGYLVSFITDVKNDRSECWLIDAKRFTDGPVCRVILPHRIASGTRSTWAPGHLLT